MPKGFRVFLTAAFLAISATASAQTPPSTTPNKTFVYVVNYYHDTLVAYREHQDGSLALSATVRTPAGPQSVAIADDSFVLTADVRADAVSSFAIDPSNGTLHAIGIWRESRGANPFSVAVSPGGHYAYVPNTGNATVAIYRIGKDGRLTPSGSVREAPRALPYHVAFTPNGRFAYVANYGNDTIGIYQRTPGKGALSARGIYHEPKGDGPYDLAVGPDGRYLYVADFRSNVLLVLKIGKDGALSTRYRLSEPFDHHPDSLVIDPSGRYLFVANTSAGDITAFHIDQKTGRLIRAGRVKAGSYPFCLTLDTAARFVYAVNFGSSSISRYRLDRRTGLLHPIGTTKEPGAAGPYGIAAITLPPRNGAARSVSKNTK